MNKKDRRIRRLLILTAIIIFSIIETIYETGGTHLGAIPTLLIAGGLYFLAECITKFIYRNKYGKKYKELFKLNNELSTINSLLEKSMLSPNEIEKFNIEKQNLEAKINELLNNKEKN